MIQNNNYIIAIDGPSGTGKSTTAKEIASRLGISYLDTGAMYRAYSLYFLDNKIDEENCNIGDILKNIRIKLDGSRCILNDRDVSEKIRTPEVTSYVSKISSIKAIREHCVSLQRDIGKNGKWVVEGRDIGTNVFPDAKYKFYLTADPEIRAKRRWIQNGKKEDFQELVESIKRRDYLDSTRAINPLMKADDAKEIDTSNMNFEEVVQSIIMVVK